MKPSIALEKHRNLEFASEGHDGYAQSDRARILDLNWRTVWQLTTTDLPGLLRQLDELIDNGETHGQS